VDDHWMMVPGGGGAADVTADAVYLAMSLRNAGNGIAVLHGWYLWPRRAGIEDPHPDVEDFHTQTRDLYVPAGDISFWQAALRDADDGLHEQVREAIATGAPLSLDLLYGDHEGGQRTITRFYMIPRHSPAGEQDEEPWLRLSSVSRHWNIDRADPR